MDIYKQYENICEQASMDENLFNNFKSSPEYNQILEHVPYDLGLEYYQKIINFNFDDTYFCKFMENDIIGNTTKMTYGDRIMSPTTLRYIYTAYDINTKINVENLDIVEIGGGYGGQCKIMYDMQSLFGRFFKSYTIIDLPSVIKLQSKYLDRLGYTDVNFVSYDSLTEIKKDFCISNYGFGELDKDIQDNYVDKVLKNCENFYIIYNISRVHDFLLNNNFKSEPEDPRSGQFNTLYYK